MATPADSLKAACAGAQASRTLDAFVGEANRIPLNATSALRPSAHRLKGEAERAELTRRTSALVETGTTPRRPTSAELVPLLWLRNLALPSPLGVPTLQG